MRVATYMKYMGIAAGVLVLTAGAARPQEQTTTPNPSAVQSKQSCSSSFDSAALASELARAQRNWKESVSELQDRARQVQREVAREMAERGIRREEMASLAAQIRAERPAVEAAARSASQEAQQLFVQSPSFLVGDEDTGWLGMEMTEVTPEKAKELKVSPEHGVVVSELVSDGPAAKAGLEKNDVIVEYDGHSVEGTVQFRRLVRETPPGRNVNVTVMRDGQEKKLTVQVGNASRNMGIELRQAEPLRNFNFKFDMPEIFAGMTPVLGIEAEEVSGQLGQYFHVPGNEGVLVREVSPGTAAAQAGLRAGDVITKVDGVEVRTVDELRQQLRDKREKKSVPLTVTRNGSQVTINVTLEHPSSEPAVRVRSAVL